MGKKKFNETLLPLVLNLLRDESVEVKSNFIESFTPIFEVISPTSILEAVEPVLNDLSKSIGWRFKELCLNFITTIAALSGKDGMKESLLKILLELSRDNFESVRDCVARTILKLKELLGEEWVAREIMPEITR